MDISVLVNSSENTDPWVRQWVAQHPQTPVHILRKLASDPDDGVRLEIALNPNTPDDLPGWIYPLR